MTQKVFLAIGGLHEDQLCETYQAIAPTNVRTVHQTSVLHIESSPDRLGLLSPTHGQRSQIQSGQIILQSVLMQQVEVSQGHSSCRSTENCYIEVRGGGGLEPVKPAREPTSSPPKPFASLMTHHAVILPVRRFLVALAGRKQTAVVRDRLFPQKPLAARTFDSRAQRFSTPLNRRRSSCPPSSWCLLDR